jgi:hypothetical protein
MTDRAQRSQLARDTKKGQAMTKINLVVGAVSAIAIASFAACNCNNTPPNSTIIPTAPNEDTCLCTCWNTGPCAPGCSNAGTSGSPCPATISPFGLGPFTNCLTMSPKICLPANMNPQLGATAPDPNAFCSSTCGDWGSKLSNLLGNPCVGGLSVTCTGTAVPNAADGGLLSNFGPTCDVPCPVVNCSAQFLEDGGVLALCVGDGGVLDGASAPGCCTQISACPLSTSSTLCAPDVDPQGIIGELFSQASLSTVDPTQSFVTIVADGGPDSGINASVAGKFTILGRPCPSGTCNVGVSFQLLPSDVTLTDGTTFTGLQVNGFTKTAGSIALIGGSGTLAVPNDFDVTGVGTGHGCAFNPFGLGCVIPVSGSEGINLVPDLVSPPTFTVDFVGHTFSMVGSFHFDGDPSDHVPELDAVATLRGTIENEPPTANAGLDQTLQCTSPAGALVTLDGSGSTDPENNIIAYSWHTGDPMFGPLVGGGPVVQVQEAIGSTTRYWLTVLDTFGQADQAVTTVSVIDTTPPVIDSITVNPDCLWPPNHEMVLFTLGSQIQVAAHDTCDSAPVAFIDTGAAGGCVDDNQPFLGGGQGNTTPDFFCGTGAVCLRAERQGTSSAPRVYTIRIGVRDHHGNQTDGTVEVFVSHDQGQGMCPNVDPSLVVADDDPRCTADIPLPAAAPIHGSSLRVAPEVHRGGFGCTSAGGELPALAALVAMGPWMGMARIRRRRQRRD